MVGQFLIPVIVIIMALGMNQNNNAANFDKNLRHLYKDKTLEVVNETSAWL